MPKEQGGPVARQGFSYQDEIAVGFLLDMIEDAGLTKIHFETHDDLILVRALGTTQGKPTAEFVQVKAGEPDKLWSVADICQRKKKDAVGTSIFETSLGRDQHDEVASFRMITLRPVISDLAPLAYAFGADGRRPGCDALTALESALNARFPGLRSPKNNDCRYWLENCLWDVRHDLKTVQKANTIRLFCLAETAGQPLLLEQINVLLTEMRAWVKAAGDAKWIPDKARKIVTRAEAVGWWQQRLAKLAQGARPSGGALAEKMKAADLPESLIAMAVDLRLGYAAKVRTATYMEPETAEVLQEQVKSAVQSLSADLAAGILDLKGPQFHARCLVEMNALNAARPSGAKDQAAFLKGCLYDIADRCLLRFDRVVL
ncbi:dsDNA nuclease domain-containing protein [Mesorhizobium sp. M0208]|uniref:dsDNA nuclease domain-containing protein n=1 Tax=unclassified Mesorhizobium TaxID=325217 RepID=UPI0033390A86